MLQGIACWIFDADDTLWESSAYFREAEDSFARLMGTLGFDEAAVRNEVHVRDIRRLSVTGYGPGPYVETLCSILSDFARNPSEAALTAMESIRDRLINHPVMLYPGVHATLRSLSRSGHRLILYTMGERDHQIDKYERSGLSGIFEKCVVVPRKTAESLQTLIASLDMNRNGICVVGNSPRSDIAPALACGVNAIFVKRPCTWAAEHQDIPVGSLVATVSNISDIPALMHSERTGGQWNC